MVLHLFENSYTLLILHYIVSATPKSKLRIPQQTYNLCTDIIPYIAQLLSTYHMASFKKVFPFSHFLKAVYSCARSFWSPCQTAPELWENASYPWHDMTWHNMAWHSTAQLYIWHLIVAHPLPNRTHAIAQPHSWTTFRTCFPNMIWH